MGIKLSSDEFSYILNEEAYVKCFGEWEKEYPEYCDIAVLSGMDVDEPPLHEYHDDTFMDNNHNILLIKKICEGINKFYFENRG